MLHGALAPAAALLSGAAAGWTSGGAVPPAIVLSVATLAWAGAGVLLRRRAERGFLAAALTGFAACGAALGGTARTELQTPLLAWYAEHRAAEPRTGGPRRVVLVEGRLARDALPTDYGASLVVDVERVIDRGSARRVHGGVRASVGGRFVRERMSAWRVGRRVRMPVALRWPPRYANFGTADQSHRLQTRGIGLLGSVKSALLVEVVRPAARRAEWAAAVRARVRRWIAQSVGVHDARSGGIVTAVLIGDRAGLDQQTTRRLQDAGTYHVIAISGGNIAVLAGLLVAGSRLLGAGRRAAALIASAGLVAYAEVVGPEPSVARATFTAVTFLLARAADLRTRPLNTLALAGACLVAARPGQLTDPGFQLTFGATLGILAGLPRLAGSAAVSTAVDALGTVGRRGARPAILLLGATLCAEAALLPIAATWFSRISLAGLALNFIAIPLMTVTQLAGMVAAALAPLWPAAAAAVGYLAHLAAWGIVESTRLVDAAPMLVMTVPKPHLVLVATYYAAWAAVLFPPRRRVRHVALGVAALATFALLSPPEVVRPARWLTSSICAGLEDNATDARLRVLFLDVGQADATLVILPGGQSLLVDAAGTATGGSDIGRRVVVPAVRAAGVRRLDYLLVTHAHPDHIGGAADVLRELEPREIWEGVPVPASRPRADLLALAHTMRSAWRARTAGERLTAGGAVVRFVHPPPPDWERPRVRNDDSVVLDVRFGDVSVVLPGDIGTAVERELAAAWPPAAIRVLKVPHHGSRSSSSARFLAALDPDLAVVSAGRDSRFGHPHPEVVRRYAAHGARLLLTGEVGAVSLCTDGGRAVVTTAHGDVRLELARPDGRVGSLRSRELPLTSVLRRRLLAPP